MGWANCGTDSKGRDIGYAHYGRCDHPGCKNEISRGLANACGGMHGTGSLGGDRNVDWDSMEVACEGYFCDEHMRYLGFEHEDGTELYGPQLCIACHDAAEASYATDPEWRAIWPTNAVLIEYPAIAMEAREGGNEVPSRSDDSAGR